MPSKKTGPKKELAAVAAAEEAEENAEGKQKIFRFGDVDLVLPRKWKRFKFLRALRSGDMWGAIEAIWPPQKDDDGNEINPVLDKIADLEVDEAEFRLIVERLGETLMGSDGGNS